MESSVMYFLVIIFWSLVYWREANHDIDVINSSAEGRDKEKAGWHTKDAQMFAIIHIFVSFLFLYYTKDVYFSAWTLFAGLGFRVAIHETIIDLKLHKDLWHRPTSKHNPFDVWLSNKPNWLILTYRYFVLVLVVLYMALRLFLF